MADKSIRRVGRKILDNTESKNLVQCTFRTSSYNKQRLIELAEQRGQTLSETLSDLLTYNFEMLDYKKLYHSKMSQFIEVISKGDPRKAQRFLDILNNL